MKPLPKISIIVPVFNEAENIEGYLLKLKELVDQNTEIIIVDGGSTDQTVRLCYGLCDRVIKSPKGRAKQMNAGAVIANGELLLFLHADTIPPNTFISDLQSKIKSGSLQWGRFDVELTGDKWMYRVISYFINMRSRLSGIATGDQAIFITSQLYSKVGGYPNIALMEDVAISKALKEIVSPICLKQKVISSSRRWEKYGVWKTIFLMWKLRFAFHRGADPDILASLYK